MERDILIVSDTHGRATRLRELIEYRKKLLPCGEVLNLIFLGDGLKDLFSCEEYNNIITHIVRGNCDTGVRFTPFGEEIPFYRVITVGNYKAFLTHGNLFNVKYDREELCRAASEMDADIVLVDFSAPHLMPCHNVISGLVFSAKGGDVAMTMVEGKILYQNGQFPTIDLKSVVEELTTYAIPRLFSGDKE